VNCLFTTSVEAEPVNSYPKECVPPFIVIPLWSNANTVLVPFPAPFGIGDKKCPLSSFTNVVSKSIPEYFEEFDELFSAEPVENTTDGVIELFPEIGDKYAECPNGPAIIGNEPYGFTSTLTYLERLL